MKRLRKGEICGIDLRKHEAAYALSHESKKRKWGLFLVRLWQIPGVAQEVDDWILWNNEDEDEEFRVGELMQAMADPVEFSHRYPIVLDEEGIVDGFHRAAAMRLLEVDQEVYVLCPVDLPRL